jgi:alcohol dehydrogenase YqhD (iron-dependent ADH family)
MARTQIERVGGRKSMDGFMWYLRTKIIFGAGRIDAVGAEARALGSKALLVTGRSSMRKLGILDRVTSSLERAGVAAVVFDEIEPNPRAATIDRGAGKAREAGCDLVIGLGGGSSMDGAKAIAASAVSGQAIWKHIATWLPDQVPSTEALPILLIPTIAATGSEANGGAVITNWDTHEKAVLWGYHLFPATSIVDPELTFSVPPHLTGDGGIDIICHVLETYFTSPTHAPLSNRFSEGVVRTVMEYLPRAMEKGDDLEARSNLSWCSTVALCGIIGSPRKGAAPIHVLQHSLSGHYDISHGRGLAILLPVVMEYTAETAPERYARLGQEIFGIRDEGRPPKAGAEACIEALRKWMRTVKMETRLSDCGIDDSKFEVMAEDATRVYGGREGFIQNPRPLGREGIVEIYRRAL